MNPSHFRRPFSYVCDSRSVTIFSNRVSTYFGALFLLSSQIFEVLPLEPVE